MMELWWTSDFFLWFILRRNYYNKVNIIQSGTNLVGNGFVYSDPKTPNHDDSIKI